MEEASESAKVPAHATAVESSLFDEAFSWESTPGSPTRGLAPITDKPNRWCVDGQYKVYSDEKFLNDKGVMTRTHTLERRVLTGSLLLMHEINNLLTRHRLEWTARPLGCYSEEFVREFYASYVATLKSQIDRPTPPPNKPHLSRSKYKAFRLISPCLPCAGIYMARMLMPTRPPHCRVLLQMADCQRCPIHV